MTVFSFVIYTPEFLWDRNSLGSDKYCEEKRHKIQEMLLPAWKILTEEGFEPFDEYLLAHRLHYELW